MCAKFGCGPTVMSKKRGGYRQTDRQTDKGMLRLYIVDTDYARVIIIISIIKFKKSMRLWVVPFAPVVVC